MAVQVAARQLLPDMASEVLMAPCRVPEEKISRESAWVAHVEMNKGSRFCEQSLQGEATPAFPPL